MVQNYSLVKNLKTSMDWRFCLNNFDTISFLADGDLNVLDDILTMDDDFDDEKDEKKEQLSGKVFKLFSAKCTH